MYLSYTTMITVRFRPIYNKKLSYRKHTVRLLHNIEISVN